ncbi:hypothetical protein B0I37DRAFT_396924 [Chaetomium sp. MPI-CAGE-AT-0009]|nr:hypothetical protein B0I37DRAFT_396924 [Chaetomium sp. MPI-CAGE-AT-0009]
MLMLTAAKAFIPPSWGRVPLRYVAVAATFVSLLLVLLSSHRRSYLSAWPSSAPPPAPAGRDVIPNTVHLVYILPDDATDFTFQFSHFLCIFAANHYLRPTTIYLHTNTDTSSAAYQRAANGTAGKWNRLILTHFPHLTIRTTSVPTHASNGQQLQNMEHRSDFVRARAVRDLGGVYLDWDAHALRDLSPLRAAGFRAVVGRQLGGQVNSGTFMSVARGRMMRLWTERMGEVYTGGWTTHSNAELTRVAERLIGVPGAREVLIVEREAFAPGGWEAAETDVLFQVHEEERSALEGKVQGDALEGFEEGFDERWAHPERFPEWARDWSATYLLHAFSPDRWGHKVPGFEHITPRYVLERRSNFARAVYPVAKMMYDQGLIEIDDPYTGT